jgi:hypothetical protein
MTTPRARMSIEDLNAYKLDCYRYDEQMAFLKWHIPTRKERIANGLALTSMFGLVSSVADGTWPDQEALRDGRYDNTAQILISQLENRCQPGAEHAVKKQPQGCLHLDESMTAGASTGASCIQNTGNGGQTKTTRWEALVDN